MNDFTAYINTIGALEFQRFRIPDYQRPYIWSVKESRQLWDDILLSQERTGSEYRIGTIILHDNHDTDTLDIIDGQQRLTTLSLLMHLLNKENNRLACDPFLAQKQFIHEDSINNIRQNVDELQNWINDELIDASALLTYILEQCSVTVVQVSDISEAFQMFDSQNGRGLALAAYNLLKAYHIRFLNDEADAIKIHHDRMWEEAAKNHLRKDYLQQVINEQLYRTRKWSKSYPAYAFSKNGIEEFKGTSAQTVKHPYQNFVHYVHTRASATGVTRLQTDDMFTGHTQINQFIINGIPFFNYVQNYIGMYRLLFEPKSANPELDFFYKFQQQYCSGFSKKGDFFLLELYKSMVMLVFDKFGVKGLRKYYTLVYSYVFRFRLEKRYVKYNSVAQFPAEAIARIGYATSLLDLNFLKEFALCDIERANNNTNNEVVESFFKNNFQIKIS